jgi:hypothetical protein
MKQVTTKPNLFVVDTPYQLLNAIEAVHSLQLTNNHLVVVRPTNLYNDRFMPLIKASDWVTVSFPSLFIYGRPRVDQLLGRIGGRWYYRYVHFQRMRTMAKLAARLRDVDKLFLGHYYAEEKRFMRHIANTIKHNTLYLLDDGTDTIFINDRRHKTDSSDRKAPTKTGASWTSVAKTIKTHLRTKYWHWYLAEAPRVTFFTIYDLDVRKGDRLIRNNYSYLRNVVPLRHTHMPDTVIFLGQCIAEGYFEIDVHFAFLSKIRKYFAKEKIIYVAHPRESASCIARIREQLHCELWPSSSIIEYDLIVQGVKPKVVAGFVSSALITLAHLMEPDVEIVCFHVAPESWMRWRDDAAGVYDYLKTKAQQRVTIVPLSMRENECGSPLPSD